MHRRMRDKLEEVLSGAPGASREQHLGECGECSEEILAMREQAEMLRSLRPPADIEPRAGFYARVLERIENQGTASIWSLFFESAFGRRIAIASVTLALCLGVYMVTSERSEDASPVAAHVVTVPDVMPADGGIPGPRVPGEDQPGVVLAGTPDRDAVLVNLVTYREQ